MYEKKDYLKTQCKSKHSEQMAYTEMLIQKTGTSLSELIHKFSSVWEDIVWAWQEQLTLKKKRSFWEKHIIKLKIGEYSDYQI